MKESQLSLGGAQLAVPGDHMGLRIVPGLWQAKPLSHNSRKSPVSPRGTS